jgi:hypothetical protein
MFKKLFVTMIFISQSLLPSFAAIVDENEFKMSWDYSPLIKRKDGNSELQMKLFKKTMWFGQTEVPVVETTFTYLKNPQDKTELKELAHTIQKTFGKGMILKSGDHLYKIEGPFKKLNRQVKIDLKSIDNSVLIVTSFIRLGFNKNVNAEVEALHRTLLTYRGEVTEQKTSWINWIKQFVVKDAQAEGLNLASLLGGGNTTSSPTPGFNFVLDTSGLTNSVNTLNGTVNNTNVQLGNANTNWGNTNVQLGNSNTNWNNTNNTLNNTNVQLGNANNNWNNTNNNLNNTNVQLGNANTNWNNTNAQIGNANANMANFNKEYGNMNTNWAESNKLMASMLDPNHMAKVAFYTAAGAALGGVAVNLAIQGVSSGISFLYELFTGTKKKKLEWEDLEKAMSVWDAQLNDLVKLEQAVDAYLVAFDFFDGKNLTNDYVKQLADSMRDMRFDRDMFMEKFKDQNLPTACRKLYYGAADELDQKLKEYDKILDFAQKTNVQASSANGAGYFCNQLKELQRKILTAENQMQDLRLKILAAENQFYSKQSDGIDSRDDKLEDINDKLGKTLKEKKKYDDKVVDRLKETHEANKAAYIDECLDGKNEVGVRINKENKGIFGGVFSHFKRKELCGNEFEKISKDIVAREERSTQTLKAEEDFRKDLTLKSNNFVDVKLSEEQMSWMTRLHVDAYCFQFAHLSQDKVPAKCKEFPEMLYSMNMSKGYEKAKAAYDNKCQDRYLKGIKSLASTDANKP